MSRRVFCVDLDAFFASVEELLNPALRGQPVLVGGRPSERGVVAACSYAARAFGVHSAMPMAQALRLCPTAIVVPPQHAVYHAYSARVMGVLRALTAYVEQVSVDEAFLDVTDRGGDAAALAHELKERIKAEVGLTATVGAASNKLVAKMAASRAKPDGLLVVPPGEEAAFLAPLPVEKLHGVGEATARKLHRLGIQTIGALAAYPALDLRRALGDWALALQQHAHGIDSAPVVVTSEPKTFSREETFARDVGDRAWLETRLAAMVDAVAADLGDGYTARTVRLKLRFPDFRTITRQTTLRAPTADAHLIEAAAVALLRRQWQVGMRVRLLGVGVDNLVPGEQLALFFPADGGAPTSTF